VLIGCSNKNKDPAPSTQPTVTELQSSQWKCSGFTHRTLGADGASVNSAFVAGTFEIRFSPTGIWYLARAADSYGPAVSRSGLYRNTGTTLVLTVTTPTSFKVDQITNDKLTVTEVFPASADGNHVEDQYQTTREP
jgi:hypothetical protein